VLLTDDGVSVNHLDSTGRNALSWADSVGHLELMKYWMSLNYLEADTSDETERTALPWAAGSGHLLTTAYVLNSPRINVASRDFYGRNAISWATAGTTTRSWSV
jgi:ankyrin repeat protein